MASLTIRNLDETLKERLREQADRNGRSMQEEAREILAAALAGPEHHAAGLGEAIRRRFQPYGAFDLPLPPREPLREPPDLGEPRESAA